MRALYSLVCRLRTVYALVQGMATLAFEGWAAMAPAQWLVLGCGLCIALRILIPSPPSAGGRPPALADRLLSVLAVVAFVGLMATDAAGTCAFAGGLVR